VEIFLASDPTAIRWHDAEWAVRLGGSNATIYVGNDANSTALGEQTFCLFALVLTECGPSAIGQTLPSC
jgi:hypothetical protein